MGKIKTIKENSLVGGDPFDSDVYPVTSTLAVYDNENHNLESIIAGLKEEINSLKERIIALEQPIEQSIEE